MYHQQGFQVRILILLCFVCSTIAGMEMDLPSAGEKYKIGMLLPFGSQSHRNCFLPLAETLAQRGHEVVILSALPSISKHPNIKEINHGIPIINESTNMFKIREDDVFLGFQMFKFILPKIAREMYDVPAVKEMYEKRNDFDLFLIDELFNEPAYPFLQGLNYASIAPSGFLNPSSSTLGNVLNPSYVPSAIVEYPRPYSFVQRMKNLLTHLIFVIYWRHYEIFPRVQKELNQHFPDFPPLAEIEKGLILVLANTHFSLDFPLPILPSQVEVGGMHCRPGKQLPQDLQSFIDGAGPEGVIYFSLGSVCKGSTIPEEYKKILVEVFSNLKQRIIWKYEEDFKGLPKNIIVRSWLPQQDILAHPKVKLFITHGGLLSMQEAIYHTTPLLALPIFGDQEKNAEKMESKGLGKYIYWESLTTELLQSTINEVINEPKYKKKIDFVSASFRDQPISPLEKAVWWTEYVIRHKGAPQLKSPAADLSWIEYLMIDVIIAIHLIVFAMYRILKLIFKTLLSFLFKANKDTKKKKKKD